MSEAKTLFHKHYEAVIGKKETRHVRGLLILKYKEVDDILAVIKILYESGPDHPPWEERTRRTKLTSTIVSRFWSYRW